MSKVRPRNIMLVDGYIRSITNFISPASVNHICFTYYFDVDPIEDLEERRKDAINFVQPTEQYETEELIVYQLCAADWSKNHRLLLIEILEHWQALQKQYEIVESTKLCIQLDNKQMLKIMQKFCHYDDIIPFINVAAKYGSYKCIASLLQEPEKIDWSSQIRPLVLLNAIKYQHKNSELIKFIMDRLEMLRRISFKCDDVMREVIKFDLVDIAKRIVNNRWHSPTEQDELLAKKSKKCDKYLKDRKEAISTNWFYENDQDQQLNIDDDEWGDSEDNDDDFDEDYDWQNED